MPRKNEVIIRVGNGARFVVLTVGTYHLSLPSGFVLKLNNCYHAPVLAASIISSSCLDMEDFSVSIKNKYCSFSCNEIFYGIAPMKNG